MIKLHFRCRDILEANVHIYTLPELKLLGSNRQSELHIQQQLDFKLPDIRFQFWLGSLPPLLLLTPAPFSFFCFCIISFSPCYQLPYILKDRYRCITTGNRKKYHTHCRKHSAHTHAVVPCTRAQRWINYYSVAREMMEERANLSAPQRDWRLFTLHPLSLCLFHSSTQSRRRAGGGGDIRGYIIYYSMCNCYHGKDNAGLKGRALLGPHGFVAVLVSIISWTMSRLKLTVGD